METTHQSVLLKEAIEGLDIQEDDVVVDATLGGAGHFSSILSLVGSQGTVIGIDADHEAIERGRVASRGAKASVHVVEGNFRDLDTMLNTLHVETITKALFDLGWSSFHITSGRGFSFRSNEPLYMTYGTPQKGKTAADLLNTASEEAIRDMLYSLGEERFARSIARSIAHTRETKRIETTQDVVDAVLGGTPTWYQKRRIHPATKTFQALRIAVNDELGALRAGLTSAINRLDEGGRVAIISFHSIEDRIVKLMLRDAACNGVGVVLTKKPITPSLSETTSNPRSRSAKLRIFEKGQAVALSSKETSVFSYA
jgi:16S rRNA (cytosine1402-N4)-methyltransferase